MLEEISTKRALVFGCGNVLMGDDGFGPAVIKKLRHRRDFPDDAHAEDVGTSIRGILFDIAVMEQRPEHIIVLDLADQPDREPGEVFEISVDDIPEKKIADYSFHQFPTTNLLRELQERCGVQVTIIAAQTAGPFEEVRPGLSPQVRAAVPRAVQKVMTLLAFR